MKCVRWHLGGSRARVSIMVISYMYHWFYCTFLFMRAYYGFLASEIHDNVIFKWGLTYTLRQPQCMWCNLSADDARVWVMIGSQQVCITNSTVQRIYQIALRWAFKLKCTCWWLGCSVLTHALPTSASCRTAVHPALTLQEADTNNRGKTTQNKIWYERRLKFASSYR